MSGFSELVFHVDMDAFFVSVEELYNPDLRGKAVVVGGRANERGVVAAASYEARKFGVHSAMPLRSAYKLCPQAIFMEGHPERYREYSKRVYEVLNSFTPKLEMASIDEAYLDMSGTERLHGPPLFAAHKLHHSVCERTGLQCSIGMGRSRLVAKIASDQAKPNGVLWVLPQMEAAFLAPLEVGKIPGVGKVTERKLQEFGIRTVAELAARDGKWLEQNFGEWGVALAGKARGEDAGAWFAPAIGGRGQPKSISHEHTYSEDTNATETLEATLARLCEMVARRLREQQLRARTLHLKLRYEDFSTITRARTLAQPTQLDTELFAVIRELFRGARQPGRKIRLLGVNASSLETSGSGSDAAQMNLLDSPDRKKWEQLLTAADGLRVRYGENAVSLAGGMKGAFRERTHENPASLRKPKPTDA